MIRSDFTRMSYASYYAELLDQLLVSDEQDETLFLLIVQNRITEGVAFIRIR